MRSPSLTYEALLAALTLGAASEMVACTKGAVSAEPPGAPPPAATVSATPTALTTTTAAPGALPPPPPEAESAKRKDGDRTSTSTEAPDNDKKAPAPGPRLPKPSGVKPPRNDTKPGGSAACGGSSCSPDMKKGN